MHALCRFDIMNTHTRWEVELTMSLRATFKLRCFATKKKVPNENLSPSQIEIITEFLNSLLDREEYYDVTFFRVNSSGISAESPVNFRNRYGMQKKLPLHKSKGSIIDLILVLIASQIYSDDFPDVKYGRIRNGEDVFFD